VVHTFEPGDTSLGRRIREILLDKDDVKANKFAELLLFEADRAQHVREVIKPSIEQNKIVICDRYNTATLAYQGYGLGIDLKKIEEIDNFATDGMVPDFTILLDVDTETGLRRAGGVSSPDKIEQRSLEFHENVRRGYIAMSEQFPERIHKIATDGEIEQTYEKIQEKINDIVQQYTRS